MSTSFPVPLSGAKASTLLWADEESIEHDARNQLRRVSSLPWVHGVRVMPDVHVGKGATVGSVIAMRDAVCPCRLPPMEARTRLRAPSAPTTYFARTTRAAPSSGPLLRRSVTATGYSPESSTSSPSNS